jgi:hypothetical protein
MTAAERAAWGRRSRAASGVPETIEDEVVLVQLARLLRGTEHRDGGSQRSRRRHREAKPRPSTQARRHGQA